MRRPVDQYTTPAMGRWLAWRASGRGHQGWDYYARKGVDVVRAISPGRVISVRYNGDRNLGFGHNVTIEHDAGVLAVYAHMHATPLVVYGQRVFEGQVLGLVGDTGNAWAVGAHCHLQTSRNGNTFNPETLFGATSSAGVEVTPFPNTGTDRAATKRLQVELNLYGYGLDEDGDYGAATTAAVKDFQRLNGLLQDGLAGVNTWRALEENMLTPAQMDELAAKVTEKLVPYISGVDKRVADVQTAVLKGHGADRIAEAVWNEPIVRADADPVTGKKRVSLARDLLGTGQTWADETRATIGAAGRTILAALGKPTTK